MSVLEDLGFTFKETTGAVSYRIVEKSTGLESNSGIWVTVYGPVDKQMAIKMLVALGDFIKERIETNWPADWPK